jgi:hypothetical protein
MRYICFKYSLRSDYARVFQATPRPFVSFLLRSPNLSFATAMALFAAWHNIIDFSEFVRSRFDQIHGMVSIVFLCVTRMSFPISDESLNQFFECVSNSFESLSHDSRSLVLAAYNQLKTDRPSIRSYNFNVMIRKATDELRFEAARRFDVYMNGECSVNELTVVIKNVKQSNAELFEHMIAVLIKEFENNDRVKLLLVELLKSKVLKEGQSTIVFSIVLRNVTQPFAGRFIEKMLRSLGHFTRFASLLLESEEFQRAFPSLYGQVERIVETFTFQEFCDFAPSVELHSRVERFRAIPMPSSRKIHSLVQAMGDATSIVGLIDRETEFREWIAGCLTNCACDYPASWAGELPRIVLRARREFYEVFLGCCSFRVMTAINDKEFGTVRGERLRRNVFVIAKLVGQFTIAVNKSRNLKYFRFKEMLRFAVSNGALYGVVPFVCEFLRQASPLFRPPNPFTSGLLVVLGSISVIPSLKRHIRNHIESLFEFFGVTLDQIALDDDLFPDKKADNFDFLAQPFNLSLMFSESQIERMIAFDQNLYFCFISKSMVLPPMKKNSALRMKLIWSIFSLIRAESTRLSDLIGATIGEICLDSSLAFVRQFAKQTAASLVSQTVFFNYELIFSSGVSQFLPDMSLLNEFLQLNSLWIHQFISDVTTAIAIARVKPNVRTGPNGPETNQWILLAATPIRCRLKIPEVSLNPEVCQFLDGLETLCRIERARGFRNIIDLPDLSSLHHALKDVPIFEDFSVEQFQSLLWTYLKYSSHSIETLYQQTLSISLRTQLEAIPPGRKQLFCSVVEEFVKVLPFQPLLLGELVNSEIISEQRLDSTYVDVLNDFASPANVVESIVTILRWFLIEEPNFHPQLFLGSLSIAAFLPSSRFCQQSILALRKLYYGIPSVLAKRKIRKEFDPFRDIAQTFEYSQHFQKFKNAYRSQSDSQILAVCRSCSRSHRDFWVVWFVRETAPDVARLFACLNKTIDIQTVRNPVFSALEFLVAGFCGIPSFDFEKCFQILKSLMKYLDCSGLLHKLRPLKCAGFTFPWVQLIADPLFIVLSLNNRTPDAWTSYLPLFLRFRGVRRLPRWLVRP